MQPSENSFTFYLPCGANALITVFIIVVQIFLKVGAHNKPRSVYYSTLEVKLCKCNWNAPDDLISPFPFPFDPRIITTLNFMLCGHTRCALQGYVLRPNGLSGCQSSGYSFPLCLCRDVARFNDIKIRYCFFFNQKKGKMLC
jgi:hypothetical protein